MEKLQKWLLVFITGWVVTFFLYPTFFMFLPGNSKQYLAAAGLLILGLNILQSRSYNLDKGLLGSLFIASAYSVINLIATDYNGASDYSYANYITSALVWLFSAYTMVSTVRFTHGTVNIRLLTCYFAAVSVLNCVLAELIANLPVVSDLINSFFSNPEELDFIQNANRLYGIGFMLDPAGTRMAIILIMIAYVLSNDRKLQESQTAVILLFLAYFIIIGIGNIVSRTTITGAALSLLVFLFSSEGVQSAITKHRARLHQTAFIMIFVFASIGIYLYNTDEAFYEQLRYGFEGFFSLVEKGEWQTDSNDVLATMWKWPETTEAWIIGYGEYGGFRFGTDIGYCRFVLYSGLVGFSVFAFMFLYQFYVFSQRYPKQTFLFFLMTAMSFIIWIKVSTDLFQFWAVLYCFHQKSWLSPEYKLALGYNEDDNDD